VKLPNGPFPDNLNQLLDDMEQKGDIIRQPKDLGLNNPQERVIPRRPVNFDLFKPQAIAIVSAIIQDHWNRNGTEMADLTHGIAWKVAEMQEAIPYESVILSDEDLNQEDLNQIAQLVQKHGANPSL
jgi:hypothetical protein